MNASIIKTISECSYWDQEVNLIYKRKENNNTIPNFDLIKTQEKIQIRYSFLFIQLLWEIYEEDNNINIVNILGKFCKTPKLQSQLHGYISNLINESKQKFIHRLGGAKSISSYFKYIGNKLEG